jgi:hypothetical protein
MAKTTAGINCNVHVKEFVLIGRDKNLIANNSPEHHVILRDQVHVLWQIFGNFRLTFTRGSILRV